MLTTTKPSTLLLPLLLSALTTASPATTKRQAPIFPPTAQSQNFNLIANITSPSCLAIDHWIVTSYHVGAGEAFAVLADPVDGGRVFYVNGSAEDVRFNRADLLSDEGTPPFPAGWSIDAVNVSTSSYGEHVVHIDAGVGQSGIALAIFPNPVPYVTGPDSGNDGGGGGYYACNNTLPFGGSAIQLLYRYDGEARPDECVDVTLLPQCVTGGTVEEFGNTVECYSDVAAINWTVFTA